MLPQRFTEIDALTRPDHYYLNEDDYCLYLGEYTARAGFSHSQTNQHIFNIKAPIRCRGTGRWRWKEQSMSIAARALRAALGKKIGQFTFVPVPPSKSKSDAEYDDRMIRILTQMGKGFDVDIREMIEQDRNMVPSHEAQQDGIARTPIDDLDDAYSIDNAQCGPTRRYLAVVDDVLTTGAHISTMKQILLHTSVIYPSVHTILKR